MLNVSRMPTIRTGWHELMRVKPDLWTLATTNPSNLGVSWARKCWVQPCRALKFEDLLGWVFIGFKKGKS